MTTVLLSAGIAGLVVVFVVSLFRTSDRHVGVFARAYDVELTERNAEILRAQIRRLRRWRLGGMAVGLLALAFWRFVVRGHVDGEDTIAALGAGLAGGMLIAELTRRTEPVGRVAAAGPRARRIRDFVVREILVALTVLGAIVATYLVHAALFRAGNPVSATGIAATRWSSVVFGSLGWIALSAGTVVALRRLAQSPETAKSADVFAAHRAVRSSAIVSLLGAFWMGMSALGARVVWPVAASDSAAPDFVHWINGFTAVLLSVGTAWGLFVCLNAVPRTGGYIRVPQVPKMQQPAEVAR